MSRRAVVIVAAVVLGGCIPQTYRMRPDAAQWRSGVRTVALLPAVHVYEVSVGDVREEKDEWTAAAEKNVIGALGEGLRQRGLSMKLLRGKGDDEIDDVKLLYEAVGSAIWQFTYLPWRSEYKMQHWEYSVGPIDRILDRAGADALVVAYARDSNSTTARKLTSFIRASSEYAIVTLGLVDRKGRVVWFDLWGGRSFDLRNPQDAHEIVQHLLANLPERGR